AARACRRTRLPPYTTLFRSCQNQSLADSNAQIAHDLRREVFDLMREGRSDAEIRDYLVARYGEFVLYRPRFSGKTWVLWLGPGVDRKSTRLNSSHVKISYAV